MDRIVVQHSKPGNAVGERWSKGSGAGLNGTKDQDKEWLAVSPSGDRVALCWTEFDHYGSEAAGDSTRILCSTTGRKAKKWSEPVSVSAMEGNCLDGDSTVEGAVPVWIDEMTLGVAWAHGEHIRWNVSEDAGATFRSYEQYIADIIGGWDQVIPGIGRANGMPVTGVAREGCTPEGCMSIGPTSAMGPLIRMCGSFGRTTKARRGRSLCGSTTTLQASINSSLGWRSTR